MFDTLSLYTVGSMYRQERGRTLALCTVFCFKAQMHWKCPMFVLFIHSFFLSLQLDALINRGLK